MDSRWIAACIRGGGLLALLVALAAGWSAAGAGAAAESDWALTRLAGPTQQLVGSGGGALLAVREDGLWRTGDGGATWRPVALPAGGTFAAADPGNLDLLYAAAPDGLHRSTDGGATWALSLATASPIMAAAVSPADSRVVQVLLGGLVRQGSTDGGVAWTVLPGGGAELAGSPCVPSVSLFQMHPTDPARLFAAYGCFAGRDVASGSIARVRQSLDRGLSLVPFFDVPLPNVPDRLVGGQGSQPGRFYLALRPGAQGACERLYRTGDGGANWSEAHAFGCGGSSPPGGLAYDPAQPERVYGGLEGAGVAVSEDAGMTWAPLGSQDIGGANDLALDSAAGVLYAATQSGVWRLDLSAGAAPTPTPAATPIPATPTRAAPAPQVQMPAAQLPG